MWGVFYVRVPPREASNSRREGDGLLRICWNIAAVEQSRYLGEDTRARHQREFQENSESEAGSPRLLLVVGPTILLSNRFYHVSVSAMSASEPAKRHKSCAPDFFRTRFPPSD